MRKLLVAVTAVLAVLLFLPSTAGAATTQITLLHGIPGLTVDVYVNGALTFDDFAPGTTKDLSGFAGATLAKVEVKLQDGTVALTADNVTLPSSGNWTVVAHLNAAGKAVLTPFENDVTPLPADEGRLTVRHTAAAPAVDVWLTPVEAGDEPLIEDLANGEEAEFDMLPAGIELSGAILVPAGADPLAAATLKIPVPTVTVPALTSLIVYAVGSLPAEGQPAISFLTQSITLELAETGASDVAVPATIGAVLALTGAGLLLVARRRPVTA